MNRLKTHPIVKSTPAPAPLAVANCKLSAAGPITVGQKLDLSCSIAGTSLTSQSVVKFENADTAQPYVIAFLENPTVNGGEIHQAVTSYKIGGHDLNQIHLTIDGKTFQVSPPKLERAIGDSKSAHQRAGRPSARRRHYPIYDPEKVPAPWWWWAIWIALLAIYRWIFHLANREMVEGEGESARKRRP